jgi:hypothetical protein
MCRCEDPCEHNARCLKLCHYECIQPPHHCPLEKEEEQEKAADEEEEE